MFLAHLYIHEVDMHALYMYSLPIRKAWDCQSYQSLLFSNPLCCRYIHMYVHVHVNYELDWTGLASVQGSFSFSLPLGSKVICVGKVGEPGTKARTGLEPLAHVRGMTRAL